jgi:hypothetical protein
MIQQPEPLDESVEALAAKLTNSHWRQLILIMQDRFHRPRRLQRRYRRDLREWGLVEYVDRKIQPTDKGRDVFELRPPDRLWVDGEGVP